MVSIRYGPKTNSFAVLNCRWAYFRLLDTKDRTFAELDVLLEKNVTAWWLALPQLDAIRGANLIQEGALGKDQM